VSDGEAAAPDDRLLLDAMLGKLATYLRMCGYDTAFALDRDVAADDRLRRLATDEARRLVTRDVALARRARGDDGPAPILVEPHAVDDQLAQIAAAGYELTLSGRPARCGACNGARSCRRPETTRPEYVRTASHRCGGVVTVTSGLEGGHWEQVADTLAASLQVTQIPELVGDLVEVGLRETLLGLLVLDDDAPEEEPDQITRRGETRPLDRLVDPFSEVLRNGDRGVVCHASWWRSGADKRRGRRVRRARVRPTRLFACRHVTRRDGSQTAAG
jgi:Uncharacterized conserved protein